jgi:hypothetical protein
MLRSTFVLLFSAAALLAGTATADVYKYVDEKGQVQYTDKPATLPAERISASQKTDQAATAARAQEELKQLQASTASRTTAGKQQVEAQQAGQVTAKDRADRCVKARERYEKATTSQRLYEQAPDGSRRYLSDAETTTARDQAKASMDEWCK